MVDTRAASEYHATMNIINITYSSNYDFNISIFFEGILTNVRSGDTLPIADNVYKCTNTDLNDDIITNMMFSIVLKYTA